MKKELPVFESWPFKVPSINVAIKKIDNLTKQLKEASNAKEAIRVVKMHIKFSDALQNDITNISVHYSIDTRNERYKKATEVIDNGFPRIQAAELEFTKAFLDSPFKAELENRFGSFIYKIFEYQMKSFSNEVVEEAIEENKLMTQYSALIASCKVNFRGSTYNLPQMGKFMEDVDRATRKEASEAYYSYLETRVDEIEEIYDKLVKVRTRMAKKMGYSNYVELAYIKMNRFDYTKEDVAAYRDEIQKYVTPIASRIMKKKFRRNKIYRPKVFDMGLYFKEGNPIPKGTTLDKIEAARKMYDTLSDETSFFFSYMADHHVMDLEAKEGKNSGGYMTYFPVYKIPFIFSNFNGTSGDVDVLTHEFGHSFQAYMARNIKVPEYRSPTMESCEIHSMSMEFFAEPYMDLFFDEPDKYRYVHLADSISFLPYGATVDEFQEWVYLNPTASKQDRDAKWHELELKYTPYKVATYKGCPYMMGGHRWLTQAHIFECPFYYIDYTLAQVMAFQFFNLDRKNHEKAWSTYLKLCVMGGKYPFRTLIKKCHLKDPFKQGCIKKTITPLVKVLKSYNF